MNIFSFLFQIVAVEMSLKEVPGYPEKFKMLNPFEKKSCDLLWGNGGFNRFVLMKKASNGHDCRSDHFFCQKKAPGT
jgi:hypothetical protein